MSDAPAWDWLRECWLTQPHAQLAAEFQSPPERSLLGPDSHQRTVGDATPAVKRPASVGFATS